MLGQISPMESEISSHANTSIILTILIKRRTRTLHLHINFGIICGNSRPIWIFVNVYLYIRSDVMFSMYPVVVVYTIHMLIVDVMIILYY